MRIQIRDKYREEKKRRKEIYRRLGIALYLLVFAVGTILAYTFYRDEADPYGDLMRGLSIEFLGITLIFFLFSLLFRWDPGEEQQQAMDIQIEEMDARLKDLTELKEDIKSTTEGGIKTFPTRVSIWDKSIKIISEGQWDKLRIYAPVGLWRDDASKKQWVKDIADCARGNNPKIKRIWAIYGLPPIFKFDTKRSENEVDEDLEYMKQVLDVFNDMKNVELHYYPPSAASIGLGALILENETRTGGTVAFALASHGDEELVDFGFGLEHEEVFFNAKEWFDDKIFRKATGNFILHDSDTSLNQRWSRIKEKWYPKCTTAQAQ